MDDADLGAQLRQVRRERGLTLADVESQSGREFKASVLGAYERGDREISVARLAKLTAIYDMTLREFLGDDKPGDGASTRPTRGNGDPEPTIDLAALERFDPLPAVVERNASGIRDRHRESGHPLTMDDDEVRALACALRRAMFEIESVLVDLERRGARAMYP